MSRECDETAVSERWDMHSDPSAERWAGGHWERVCAVSMHAHCWLRVCTLVCPLLSENGTGRNHLRNNTFWPSVHRVRDQAGLSEPVPLTESCVGAELAEWD
jgi:hypothetical protein